MNEYTRREEVRWTLITAVILVTCIAAAIVALTTAKGLVVPDAAAQLRATEAAQAVDSFDGCPGTAATLIKELNVFKELAATAKIAPKEEDEDNKGGEKKPKDSDGEKKDTATAEKLAWAVAEPTHRHARTLATCRPFSDQNTDGQARTGWDAVALAAAVTPPEKGDKHGGVTAARTLLKALHDAPLEDVQAAVSNTAERLAADAQKTKEFAATATVRQPLPEGLLGRKVAIATGLGLALIGLLVSFFSVRAASVRRALTLIPLRASAKGPGRGAQAAAILKLAAAQNGGEPGIVIGAATGGLIAALLSRSDADWFVAGVMGGLVVGLIMQILVRVLLGTGMWRRRASELAEVEKPTIPIVLVLTGVKPGLENQFVDFLDRLTPQEAASAVEKLATQAEEQILMAADAGAAQ